MVRVLLWQWASRRRSDKLWTNLGPLYTTVEKSTGRSRILAQNMVGYFRRGWYVGEDEKTIKYFTEVRDLQRPSFLFEALRLPKKLDLRRTPLLKSIATLATMSFYHPCTKLATKGHSVNHHRTRVSLSANQISQFPYNSRLVVFSTVV